MSKQHIVIFDFIWDHPYTDDEIKKALKQKFEGLGRNVQLIGLKVREIDE